MSIIDEPRMQKAVGIDEPRMQSHSGTTKPRIKKTNKALRKVLQNLIMHHTSCQVKENRGARISEETALYPQTACSFTVDQHDSKKQDSKHVQTTQSMHKISKS
jgi:hypothetical protein